MDAVLNTHTQTLTSQLKEFCLSVGFDAVGIARAEPLTDEQAHLDAWLAAGYHGTMQYMERTRDKRLDPRLVLPSARSIIVVALSYDTPARHTIRPGYGKLSRYSWGDDYHDVMLPKLQRVVEWLSTHVSSCESKAYVDTGPVMEKQWARRAGIGWQGKNTNIISRTMGSFFFLGVVLTSAELDPDEPSRDYCGTCTACLDACPTGALVAPYILDSSRCISYWTIETKPDQEFPDNIRANLDGWLFGCDVCQDVCPWNRFRKETTIPAFAPRNDETSLLLEHVLSMTPEEFRQRFRHSPIKRAKLAGLQRNARMLLFSAECPQRSDVHASDHSQ
ncbi:MAG: tRNA epoxyqueuosine(34) reductase QueG [Bacteroidota bacterium]|nr:tRNA epoxyqueuosine(34) reductase QueG [Bacteroidota bacterium]